jgi:peptidoglycan/LPS O-acetylase OafA/YrhL
VAVLLVVLTHAGVGALPGGFVGVDVFFVVSGFLITGLLLAEARAKGSVSLVDFYARRARRILPAAALTLLATDVAVFFLMNFVRARDAVHDSLYAAGFGANFRFLARATDYFAQSNPPSPFLHFWSLSVEEQFYLAWPAVLSLALFGVLFARRRRDVGGRQQLRLLVVLVTLAILSLAWSIHLTATVPSAAYFSPFTRAWELGLGAALAVGASALIRLPAAVRLVMGWTGLAAIAVAAVRFSDATPFPGFFAVVPTLGTALAIAAGIGDAHSRLAPRRLLALRPMCFIGDRSYALYLWHWPFLILAAAYVGHDLSIGVNLGLVVAALIVSCCSYALVENPIRRRTHGRRAGVLVFAVSMVAVLATATVSLAAIGREQQRFEGGAPARAAALSHTVDRYQTPSGTQWALPEVVAAVQSARRGDPIPTGLAPPVSKVRVIPPQYALPSDCMTRNAGSKTTSKLCRLGAPGSKRLIVLIGDSHAWMWLPTVLELAWRDGWAVVPLVRTGCMPNRWVTGEGPEGCRQWYRWALGRVRALHPQVTLVGGSVGERQTPTEHAAIDGIISMARALKPIGRVAVIGDPEGLDKNPVDCLLASNASMKTCTTSWPAEALSGYNSVAVRSRRLGVGFVATRGFFCFDRECPAVIGHTIAYSDNSHITAVYAAALADAFRAGFQRAARSSR